MYRIHQKSLQDLRKKYSEVAEIVKAHDDVVITNNGHADSVLINPREYEEFKTYQHCQYIAEALREVESEKDNSDYWMSEENFWAGLD